MVNDERSNIFFRKIKSKNTYTGDIPRFLYKYRKFDDFTMDMLNNNYLFVCKARKLDDDQELDVHLNKDKFWQIISGYIKPMCAQRLLLLFKDSLTNIQFENFLQLYNDFLGPNLTIPNHRILDLSLELNHIIGPELSIIFANMMAYINDALNNQTVYKIMNSILDSIYIKDELGVCSFTTKPDNSQMWKLYADKYNGYCIEYDLKDYAFLDQIYITLYEDERNIDLVDNALDLFLNYELEEKGYDKILNFSFYPTFHLLAIKEKQWEYQDEWRLISDANEHIPAPKISSILIGFRMQAKNKKVLIKYCEEHEIKWQIAHPKD